MSQEFMEKILLLIAGGVITTFFALLLWGIKSMISATTNNTQQLAILNSKIAGLLENDKKIPKIEADLNNIHQKWRDKYGDESKKKD